MKAEHLIIREAKIEDLDAVLNLCHQLVLYDYKFDNTLDRNWADSAIGRGLFTARIVNHDGIVLVADLDGQIVGYLIGGLIEPIPYRKVKVLAELEEIFVLDVYRSYAIGSKLLDRFYKWCRAEKAEKIQVVVSRDNHRGLNFYHRMGFHEHNMVLETTP